MWYHSTKWDNHSTSKCKLSQGLVMYLILFKTVQYFTRTNQIDNNLILIHILISLSLLQLVFSVSSDTQKYDFLIPPPHFYSHSNPNYMYLNFNPSAVPLSCLHIKVQNNALASTNFKFITH